ncbi:MAG: hypothetical protein A2428_00945 [Bdellovibrionales bacterium RIFOXYC1_FULL_54_43]|nr:MAG: hypothetical protein A2428_00945 [Bdellovibrionales bacterium RIFOXYC1_FULL_54_43]OFZ82852.1 MAG: hypothetical protein A2603_11670 [Bdellovibrionales bacterium RIFOXYD1_FULL_55_31]
MSDDLASTIPPTIKPIVDLIGSSAIRKSVYRVSPGLWELPDETLFRTFKPSNAALDLRKAFWDFVPLSLARGDKIKISKICAATSCSYAWGYELFTQSPEFIVWLFRPIRNLRGHAELELLSALCDRVSEIAHAPVIDDRGRVLSGNAKAVMRAVDLLWPLVRATPRK